MGTAFREREVTLKAPAHDLAPRLVSFDPQDFPVPTGREEAWRFTPLARLRGLHDSTAAAGQDPEVQFESVEGVGIARVGRDDARLGSVHVPADRASAQAFANFARAVVIEVAPGVVAAAPATVRLITGGGVAYGHVFISLGSNSRATIILEHSGAGASAVNIEVALGQGASLTLANVAAGTASSVQLGWQHVSIGPDATFKSVVVTLGGDVVRVLPTVSFAGPGGSADLVGVYFTGAGQHHEHRLFVEHDAPDCRSDVIYKGALAGQGAHSVWIGDVLIRAGARGTSTYEVNRNLVLTPGARADSVPNLEIETGQIQGAGHASTTGRFDDEQLFYLMSRGIPAPIARQLVVRGFFADALARIDVPDLVASLMARVDEQLDQIEVSG